MSNFKCDKCGMTNVDCGLGVFKTPKEIELEKLVKELKEENEKLKKQLDIEKTKSELLKDLKIKDIIELALQKMKELNNDQ